MKNDELDFDVSTVPMFMRKIPDTLQERILFLATVLAYGCMQGYWTARIRVQSNYEKQWKEFSRQSILQTYLHHIWNYEQPDASLLQAFGYFRLDGSIERENEGFSSRQHNSTYTTWDYIISPKSFALLEVPLEHKVFISYRRSESSAFALLLRDRLHAKGFDVFIDMQKLNPGEIWRDRLQEEIMKCDVFIGLMSAHTLESENVRDELRWAMEYKKKSSIAIWHNGYFYDGKTYSEFEHFLSEKNVIKVEPEHVLGYDNAITQLMQFLKPEG